jgi:sugar/nucleoside kinase (ribokinase family)
MCTLWPAELIQYRLTPPMTVMNDVAAGILATAGFLYGIAYKYSCANVCDFTAGEVPKLWLVLEIMFVCIL